MKMLAATKVKMSGSEKTEWTEHKHFLHKTRKQEAKHEKKFHVLVVQNNGKEMYKKVCCTCKVVSLLIRKKSVLHVQSFFFAN